ncbi:MAG TPA: hypothetical protein EYP98_03325, partial [Planctomycetes bacterium]|nr:hypothetical protein [Planctomycetota bacterium]
MQGFNWRVGFHSGRCRRRMLGIPCAVGEDEQALPELPEVETVRRGAEPHLVGRRLRTLELRRDDLRWPMPKKALQSLVGRKCTSVKRRSKYLLVQFDGPKAPTALIHLGMTGNLIVDPIGPRAMRPEYRKHEHWRMDFGDRLMRFIETPTEKQLRVKDEWQALAKSRGMNALQFEAEWEGVTAELTEV